MKRKDKETVKKAMELIKSDDGFEEGMEMLFVLVHGCHSRFHEMLKDAKSVSVNVLRTTIKKARPFGAKP